MRLEVKADALDSPDAVTALSEVIAEATSPPAAGPLTYAIDFGDGTVTSAASARHVYGAPGTFTITATVTDGQSRQASDSRQLTVRTVSGSWFQAEYVRRSGRVEVRRLLVTEQSGATLRGVYRVTGSPDRAFTAALTPPRNVRISIESGASLDGVLPGRLEDESGTWPLDAHGDSVDGQRLEFRRIPGEPATSPPNAEMKVSFGDESAWAPYAALTPVGIDATVSRGSGLAYFIDFGDGFVAAASRAAHVVDVSASVTLTAKVTVVDAFGRSDSESFMYHVDELGTNDEIFFRDYWISSSAEGPGPPLFVEFASRSGLNYVGAARFGFPSASPIGRTPALATLSEGPHIRITLPALGIAYEGGITMAPGNNALMTLVQRGGGEDGRTWRLRRSSYY